MNNEKSYSEIMKKANAKKQTDESTSLMSTYTQMVIDEAWLTHQRDSLKAKIDLALDTRDVDAFMSLSAQYKVVLNKLVG